MTHALALTSLPPVLQTELARYQTALDTRTRYVPERDVTDLAKEWAARLRAGLVRTRDDPRPCRAWMRRLEGALPVQAGLNLATINASVLLICADLPNGVYTDQTLAAALAKWHHFPVAADVLGLLQPYAERLEQPIRRLEETLATRKPPVASPPYDPGPATLTAPAPSWRDIQPPLRSVAEQIAALNGG